MNKTGAKFVIAVKYGVIHYQAVCLDCSFVSSIEPGVSRQQVRYRVRQHVLKTGHSVTVESGTATTYKLEEER